MLLIIHNLPSSTRYADVKALIKDKCGLTEMIVDNLVADGNSKKVTVGLADEGDAATLIKALNGLYVYNQQLYVEDVRQKKKSEQPFSRPVSEPYEQEQYNQIRPPPFENQYYEQQNTMQFQPPPMMNMESQQVPPVPPPNFGVPFYMSAQNQNVGNNLQYMVQYPKLQGPGGNEPYERRDEGTDQQYGGQKRNQPTTSDRGSRRERSPKRSRWNEPDSSRSEGRRALDRPAQRDERYDADKSYKDNSYRDSYQNRSSSQDYRSKSQSNNRSYEKSYDRSEPQWERRSDRPKFREQSESYRFSDSRNTNARDQRFNQEREPQRFRENKYSQSSGYNNESRSADFSRKRPYESPDKNKFTPPNKKFGKNQQRNSMNQQGPSGSSFSKNYQNHKNSYPTKPQPRAPVQANRPQVQPKGQQKPMVQKKPQVQKQPNANAKPTQDALARHEAWRVQAAAVIATEIHNNFGKTRNKRDPMLAALKSCVRARIDVVVGNDMSLTLKNMFDKYHEKFQDDEAFYKTVCEKAAKGELHELGTIKEEKEAKAAKMLEDIKPKTQFIGQLPAFASNSAKLPKYPAGDKKVLSQMKQAQREEIMKDTLYTMDEDHEKALKEELDKFEELIKQQCENPEDETDKTISKFMDESVVPHLRKILSLHVRKRILDVRTNLCVRVICQYKPPKRELLNDFLKNYGVISIRPTDRNKKFQVAVCDTYDNFDALCKKESAEIDNLRVTFKPFNMTGPPIKGGFKKQLDMVAAIKKSDVAGTKVNENGNNNQKNEDEGQDLEIKEEKNNSNDQENEENEGYEISPLDKSEDVILIENDLNSSKDTIVIEEDIQNMTNEENSVNADSKTETGENEESSINKESVIVDSDKANIPDNSEDTEQDVRELVDNDDIADDDLEDF